MKAALDAREAVPDTLLAGEVCDVTRLRGEAFVEVPLALRGVEPLGDPVAEATRIVWRWLTCDLSHWFSSRNWMTARSWLTKFGSLRIMAIVWPVASVTGLISSGDTSVVTY
jgi:hypothetical protein